MHENTEGTQIADHNDLPPRPYLGDALKDAGFSDLAAKCDNGDYCGDRNEDAESNIAKLIEDLCDDASPNFNAEIGSKVLGGFYDHTPRS